MSDLDCILRWLAVEGAFVAYCEDGVIFADNGRALLCRRISSAIRFARSAVA